MAMLKFLALGPLEIRSAGTTCHIQGSFQAILLFALLLNQDRLTSADELIEEVWGQGHPHKPENALQAHISRLRRSLRTLESDRNVPWLTSHASGYRLLDEEIEEFDGKSFVRAIGQLRDPASQPPQRSKTYLRGALEMWRGPVLGGITGGPICQAGVRYYEEMRLTAFEMLFDAELELGNHAAIISEVSELATVDSPFQERYCEQQVIALCRSGRHADALDVCRGTWHRLVMAGAGSFSSLRYFEHAILCHDPILNTRRARVAIA
jgi:SARP family transcriptional regulator, regulator of embCAB operon